MATSKKAAVKTAAVEQTPKVLKVKTGLKYRGAREAWYQKLCEYDGKSAEDYLVACSKKPPSLPKSGKAEAATGWFRFFRRVGACHLVEAR